MKNKLQFAILLFIIALSTLSSAEAKNKFYFGGGIGASMSSAYTQFTVQPLVGYKINSHLSVGLQGNYQYLKDKHYSPSFETYNYGGSLFSRLRIFKPIYAHAEYALLNYGQYGTEQRIWVPMLLVGGGYSHSLGSNARLNLQILFDILQNENSPYEKGEAIFSAGLSFGF